MKMKGKGKGKYKTPSYESSLTQNYSIQFQVK